MQNKLPVFVFIDDNKMGISLCVPKTALVLSGTPQIITWDMAEVKSGDKHSMQHSAFKCRLRSVCADHNNHDRHACSEERIAI